MSTERNRYNPHGKSLESRLANYKSMHAGTAEKKGVSVEFKLARTLTQARKILWGIKRKMRGLSR